MQGGWAVREDWATANLASISTGLEKLKNVGEHLTERSKQAQSILKPMIEDAFELREKTEAQRELERWTAEQEQRRAPTPQPAAKPRRFSGVVAASPATAPATPATVPVTPPPASTHSTPAASQPASASKDVVALTPPAAEAALPTASAHHTPAGSEEPAACEDEGETGGGRDVVEPEEATMQDKVILQQRMQLEQLKRDKAAAEQEQQRLRTQVAMLQRSSPKAAASLPHSVSSTREAHADCDGFDGDSTLQPFLPKGLRSLRAKATGAVGQRRSIALVVMLVGTLALVLRMLTRVDAEDLPDTEWDLEIDHSEMQRLVAALTADKARVAGGVALSGGGNSSSALDRDLATLKTILNDLHRKSMKGHGHAAPQLFKDNQRLEQELKQLRAEIATYCPARVHTHTPHTHSPVRSLSPSLVLSLVLSLLLSLLPSLLPFLLPSLAHCPRSLAPSFSLPRSAVLLSLWFCPPPKHKASLCARARAHTHTHTHTTHTHTHTQHTHTQMHTHNKQTSRAKQPKRQCACRRSCINNGLGSIKICLGFSTTIQCPLAARDVSSRGSCGRAASEALGTDGGASRVAKQARRDAGDAFRNAYRKARKKSAQ